MRTLSAGILLGCVVRIVLLAFTLVAEPQNNSKSLPTDDEIRLVILQTERAIRLYKPLVDEQQEATRKDIQDAEARGCNERREASPPVRPVQPPSHVPHTARRVRLRCLDTGANCRTQQHVHVLALCPSFRRRGPVCDVQTGWAQNWAQRETNRIKRGGIEAANSIRTKEKYGGRDRDRTGDPLLAKQVLSQLSYTPTVGTTFILRHLRRFQKPFLRLSVITVPKPPCTGAVCASPRLISLAWRLSFSRASRFMASFICEYFLNTSEFPCRSSCMTHSSATPPALSRVA
jgi:hypothetical protein